LAAVVFVSGCAQPGNNTTQQNNTTVQQNATNTSAKAVDVVATQKGPATAHKGDNVTITYSVLNNGNESVFNVKISSQDFQQNIGTLKPGETRTFNNQMHIPTDQEVQQDFGSNATVANPFYIGGFSVSFTDSSGAKHSILSNSISINLS
jgi:heme/copper-type cytochrome/quinol oxidase subunit 2